MKTAINTASASPLVDSMVQYKALERGEARAEHLLPMPLVLQDGTPAPVGSHRLKPSGAGGP